MPTYEYECQACGHAFEEMKDLQNELDVLEKELA